MPVIATADGLGTVGYFEQTLGFNQQWIWGDPPVYAGLRAGAAMLYVNHDPDLPLLGKSIGFTPMSSCG